VSATLAARVWHSQRTNESTLASLHERSKLEAEMKSGCNGIYYIYHAVFHHSLHLEYTHHIDVLSTLH